MTSPAEIAKQMQDALRITADTYRFNLRAAVYDSRTEQGVKKVLEYAKEKRAQALFKLAGGTKEKFDAYQATWKVWDDIIQCIEVEPKRYVEDDKGEPK